MTQIKRIEDMEKRFDLVASTLKELESALDHYQNCLPLLKELKDYYSSLWLNDYQDDEEGKLPSSLKRGVLSQDGLYDLLCDIKRIKTKMKELGEYKEID